MESTDCVRVSQSSSVARVTHWEFNFHHQDWTGEWGRRDTKIPSEIN